MTNRQKELIGPLVALALLEIAWYVFFWYFYLPEQPYTFRNAAGEWIELRNLYPYSSATPFEELPVRIQQGYIISQALYPIVVFIVGAIGIGILQWIEYKISSWFA